jgi:hypothetical protein
MDMLMRRNRIGTLGFGVEYTPMHWFTISNFMLARDHKRNRIAGDVMAGELLNAHLHINEATDTVMSWPEIQARYSEANTVGGLARGDLTPEQMRYEQAALIWFRLGDKPAVIRGAYAVYTSCLKTGASEAAARRAAVLAVDDVLASGRAQAWTDLTTQPTYKPFTQFAQPRLGLRQQAVNDKYRQPRTRR